MNAIFAPIGPLFSPFQEDFDSIRRFLLFFQNFSSIFIQSKYQRISFLYRKLSQEESIKKIKSIKYNSLDRSELLFGGA